MRAALGAALFLAVLAVALLACGLLLPWLKEGSDIEDLPLFASAAAVLLAVAGAWWAVNRGRRGPLFVLGLAALAVPFAAHALVALRLGWNELQGRRLARTVAVTGLRETAIHWPGIDGPVGVRLEIHVRHAIGRTGFAVSPRIAMGSDPWPDRRQYFFGAFDHGVDDFLGSPIFEPEAPARDLFARAGSSTVAYEVFPSRLRRRAGGGLCVDDGARRGAPTVAAGSDLGAAWFFVADGGTYVDLGVPLTRALRRWSRLQGDAAAWQAMMVRLEPAALARAGYRPCAAAAAEPCYCPPQPQGGEP